jgi:PilZ domain
MSSKERRLTPRKACTIPIRFRTFTSEYVPVNVNVAAATRLSAKMGSVRMATDEEETLKGETIDLSERGISFKSDYKFKVGESVELFFTLPRELTGRGPKKYGAMHGFFTLTDPWKAMERRSSAR